jgi:L-lactate permease
VEEERGTVGGARIGSPTVGVTAVAVVVDGDGSGGGEPGTAESAASGGSTHPLTGGGAGRGAAGSPAPAAAASGSAHGGGSGSGSTRVSAASSSAATGSGGKKAGAPGAAGAAAAPHAGDAHAKEAAGVACEVDVHYDALHPPSAREVAVAWFPWLLISVAVCVWGAPDVKGVTAPSRTGLSVATLLLPMGGLDLQVVKPDPRYPPGDAAHAHAVEAKWTLDLLAATGVCLLLCALVSSAVFRLPPAKTAWVMWRSFRRMASSFLTICTLLALGYVIKFSGMDTTLGLAAAKAGAGFPFLGPYIGFLGVVITGSATSSNVLFGSLQVVAAQAIGANPVQLAAANVAGGVLGHIISTSSMVVAAVSTGSDARSIGPIAASVAGYALALITLFAGWNILIVNAFPGFIPSYVIPAA